MPEYDQRNADVEDDEVIVGAFLELIARDIEARPEALKPPSNETFEIMRLLAEARKANSISPR